MYPLLALQITLMTFTDSVKTTARTRLAQLREQDRQAGLRGNSDRHGIGDLQTLCAVKLLAIQEVPGQRAQTADVFSVALREKRVRLQRRVPQGLGDDAPGRGGSTRERIAPSGKPAWHSIRPALRAAGRRS